MTHDFAVAARIVALNGTTERIDLDDHSVGLSVEMIQEPDDAMRSARLVAPRVPGSFRTTAVEDDGTLLVVVTVEGSSWQQVEGRWQAVRAAYRAEPEFFLDTEIEGVLKRWRTERPDVSSAATESASLVTKSQTYNIRFRVQPNPTVTLL